MRILAWQSSLMNVHFSMALILESMRILAWHSSKMNA